jgi:GNAT superfamily N-acetyltransferase
MTHVLRLIQPPYTYLRIKPAEHPETSYIIRRASSADAEPIQLFWNKYYRGDDWYFQAPVSFVAGYVNDLTTIVLLLFDGEMLCGTIVSAPLNQPITWSLSERKPPPVLRIIEGLVVAPAYRGKGIAGHLISAADAYTSTVTPCAHLWARELPTAPWFHTAMHIAKYAYISCEKAKEFNPTHKIQTAPWAAFVAHWARHVPFTAAWLRVGLPEIPPPGLDIWVSATDPSLMAAVVKTRRYSADTNQELWEVQYVSNPDATSLFPFLESVASKYTGCLFVTDSPAVCGEKLRGIAPPWYYGRSGFHAWYIYNYIPPMFGSTVLYSLRPEL